MKPTIEQIGDLLALKRNERPEEGYWQDFLCEFHHNQRQQSAKVGGFVRIISQFRDFLSETSPTKWAYGAGLAYAAVTISFFLMPRDVIQETAPASPVNYQVVPSAPPVEQLDQLDLSPTTQGNIGEQVF